MDQYAHFSEVTQKTIAEILRKHRRTRLHVGTQFTFFDMTSATYDWLLPGWVAEERRVQGGRLYRYYYDPKGHFYESKKLVKAAWEKCGIIVIDK